MKLLEPFLPAFKKKFLLYGIILIVISFTENATGQIFENPQTLTVNFAAKLNVGLGSKKSSFYHLSVAVGIYNDNFDDSFNFTPGAQLAVNFYTHGLGTSILDALNRRGQIDFITSFYILSGVEVDNRVSTKFVRNFHQLTASTIFHTMDYSVWYGTNFIFNNNKRNQQLGFVGLNIDQIIFGYYNDGFIPFIKPLIDGFDRYWTGGGYLAIGLNTYDMLEDCEWCSEQYLEFAFDRFTGDIQKSYKLSKELLFTGIPQSDFDQVFLNRGLTSLSLRNNYGSHLGIGILGHCEKLDIQDFSHKWLGYSRHLSFADCVPIILGSYQYNYQSEIKR